MIDDKKQTLNFFNHPQVPLAIEILKTLKRHGFEALIAGGAVRDALMGRDAIQDLDIATSAQPDEVESLFPKTLALGKAFGVIQVRQDSQSLEVATFRQDQNYVDGRRPTSVVFTSREEDAKRRDFTINAMFYDPLEERLYDDVGGLEDLKKGLLRTVGEAEKRFQEDELRRLRLIRFVSQLGFSIEKSTWVAVQKNPEGLNRISRERVTEEVLKMWRGAFLKRAFPFWLKSGLAQQVDSGWQQVTEQDFSKAHDLLQRQTSEKAWLHYFSFFWKKQGDLEPHLRRFKLSREIEKFLQNTNRIYQRAETIFQLNWGEQWQLFSETEAESVLDFCLADHPQWQTLKTKLQAQGPLPLPLLKGSDLQSHFQGAALGEILHRAYREQLNQNWQSFSQAYEWAMTQKK